VDIIITLLFLGFFLFLHFIFRNSHLKMHFLLGSAIFLSVGILSVVACANYFDNGPPRRLKMPVLVKTSSSTF